MEEQHFRIEICARQSSNQGADLFALTGGGHQWASLRSVWAMKFISNFPIVPPMLWNFSNSRRLQRFFVACTGGACVHYFRPRSRLLLKWGQIESLKRWVMAEDHMPAPQEDEGHCLNGHTPRAAVLGLKGMEDDTLTFLHLCAPCAAPRNCTISQSMPLCHTPVEFGALVPLRNIAVVPRKPVPQKTSHRFRILEKK